MSQTTMLKDWLQHQIVSHAKRHGTVTANDVRGKLFEKFPDELAALKKQKGRDSNNFIGSAFGVLVRLGEIRVIGERRAATARSRHKNEVKVFELA